MRKCQTALFMLFCLFLLHGYAMGQISNKILAANSRSDTIDILKYTINLNITDFTNKTISGNTAVRFAPKMNNINTLSLDLLQLTVDSIQMNNSNLSYSYNDTLIIVDLPATESVGDTSVVTVFYHGTPQTDASGWGGFYFQNGYAYNLGVGFAATPHNYGRVWFPCFDNFVERSKYEFNITTNNGNIAFCNGYLAHDTTDSNGMRTRTWIMDQTIPSYLACVDVGPYTQLTDTFNGINRTIPILLAAAPSDTTKLKASFVHLKDAIRCFENRYGPYVWNKVGYSLVPFSSGAMEHASNIAYPEPFVDGTTTYEAELMAHELSHHWFGDEVTCKTAGDMWLNEGMASYSQSIFKEWVYGENAYKADVKANHENVLHYCHIIDHGYRAVSGVPQAYTYGNTVYQKGADVASTLRAYMGDSLFFAGLKYYLASNKFKAVTSTTLENSLETATGLNLNDFFTDWVFNPGFPHFSVDSMHVSPSGNNYQVTVYVKQKLTGAPAYFNNVPLQITFKDKQWHTENRSITMSGQTASFSFTLHIDPAFVALNMDDKIAEAVSADSVKINNSGTYNLSYGRMVINVSNAGDSDFVYVQHNYTAPDAVKDTSLHYRISPNHYWKVNGLFSNGFQASGKLYFDGRKLTSGGGGYLDTALTVFTRDSLILLYRRNAGDDWKEFPAYSKTTPGPSNLMYGYFTIDSLVPGEYAFANGISHVAGVMPQKIVVNDKIKVYPNPAQNNINILFSKQKSSSNSLLMIYDGEGRIVHRQILSGASNRYNVSTKDLSNGIYFISVRENTRSKKVLKSLFIIAK